MEVDHQIDTHALGESPGNTGVTGEVSEYLECESVGGDEIVTARQSLFAVDGVDGNCKVVSHIDLVEEAHDDQSHALQSLVWRGVLENGQLGEKMVRPLDWTGNQLRKKRYEVCKIQDRIRRLRYPSIDVDRVRHRLKRVEGDAHRKDDIDNKRVCGDSNDVE